MNKTNEKYYSTILRFNFLHFTIHFMSTLKYDQLLMLYYFHNKIMYP